VLDRDDMITMCSGSDGDCGDWLRHGYGDCGRRRVNGNYCSGWCLVVGGWWLVMIMIMRMMMMMRMMRMVVSVAHQIWCLSKPALVFLPPNDNVAAASNLPKVQVGHLQLVLWSPDLAQQDRLLLCRWRLCFPFQESFHHRPGAQVVAFLPRHLRIVCVHARA
jgi:hypothetical protein